MVALSDPFERYDVPVDGGTLHVARAGLPPDEADAVVLALHGLTSSLMIWRTVARALSGTRLCLLAPDLRGRGRSGQLAGPVGFAAHIADLQAVLDHFQVERAVIAGHSLGAYIAACLAAQHPDRASALVLCDSGLPFQHVPKGEPAEIVERAFGAAIGRLRMTFDSVDEYVDRWHAHPAFARIWQPGFAEVWNEDVDAYARYDIAGEPGALRCVVSERAVLADSQEMLTDEETRTALNRVRVPVHLLRASRGVNGYDLPLIGPHELRRFTTARPDARLYQVWGVNHYTLAMGASPGPRRVAATIERAAEGAATNVRARV